MLFEPALSGTMKHAADAQNHQSQVHSFVVEIGYTAQAYDERQGRCVQCPTGHKAGTLTV